MADVKRYEVAVHLTYAVQAESPEAALAQISSQIGREGDPQVDFSVRDRGEESSEPSVVAPLPPFGLAKAIYTVAEAASILGTSRSSIYEHVGRDGGLNCIRLGNRIRISRESLLSVLNGDVSLIAPSESAIPRARPFPSYVRRQAVQQSKQRSSRKRAKKPEDKDNLSVNDVARLLGTSTSRIRTLLDEKKIFYVSYGARRSVPRKSLENFANGLPPLAMVEENIARARSQGPWDAEMEKAAEQFRAEWAETVRDTVRKEHSER